MTGQVVFDFTFCILNFSFPCTRVLGFWQEGFFYQFVLPPSAIEHGAAIVHDGEGYGVTVGSLEVACKGADAIIACERPGLCRDASCEVGLAKPVAQGAVNAGMGEEGEEGLVDVWSLPRVSEK